MWSYSKEDLNRTASEAPETKEVSLEEP